MPDNITFNDIIDAASEEVLFGGYEDAEDLYMDPEYFSRLDDAENPADDLFESLFDDTEEVA